MATATINTPSDDITSLIPKKAPRARPLFDPPIVKRALVDSFRKLNPRTMMKNPVMFVVEVGAAMVTVLAIQERSIFGMQIAIWLWFTVLFANFAEAMAEGRGKAQADTLRKTKSETTAHRVLNGRSETVAATQLRSGDIVRVEIGETIPGDGDVIEGIASVDESAITGESAPVIRESGGDRSAVTGGTKVLSDFIVVRITSNPGETFLDRMIALVEGAERQKTPNEIALNIVIAGLTLIFLLAVVTLHPLAVYSGAAPTVTVLVSLLVCLIPTTIGGLLSAIGIAGMDRVMQHNVLAMSGKAVEAAGDVNTLLLDKTGTITLGNRQAVEFIPVDGAAEDELADAAQLSSLADETPEGRSIVVLAKQKYNIRGREVAEHEAHFIPFTAQTRMSGVDLDGRRIRKGATESVMEFVHEHGGIVPTDLMEITDRISRSGGTPLVVADRDRALGIVHLKDVVKGGMRERFQQLRAMGIRTVMITGDNPLTAAAIASEAGVDDFLAQATPKDKMDLIKKEQAGGRLVAMTGDGTNDAPALAQADVGVAMNTGTMAAKEAGNMVDLDSNPTKLIEVVAIGKQLLMTRGALTTFSIANDIAKYFAILPAMFMTTFPVMAKLNIMRLHSPESAVLAAVIFNALIIIALIPLALRGVKYRPMSAAALLRRNLLVYGVGGVIVPFPGIWLIDRLLERIGVGMKQLIVAIKVTVVLTILTGVVYPLLVTGLAKALFRHQANGSMIANGSEIIGQKFTRPEYFHGRPDGYDGLASGGSTLGPTNEALAKRVEGDIKKFRDENPTFSGPVPADLVTASGSGLDPDISPAAAEAQVDRVAAARGASAQSVRQILAANTEGRQFGILGEPRVNVLKLNLVLDRSIPKHQ